MVASLQLLKFALLHSLGSVRKIKVYVTVVNSEEDSLNRIEFATNKVRDTYSLKVNVKVMRKRPRRSCVRKNA